MESKPPHTETGFLQSIKLMLVGGLLLLALIVATNKLIIYYLYGAANFPNNWLGNLAQTEAKVFAMASRGDLYLTWFAFVLCLPALIAVMVKLVKTWSD